MHEGVNGVVCGFKVCVVECVGMKGGALLLSGIINS